MIQIPQSTTRRVMLKLFLTGTTTAATGKTLAIVLSKAGAAFGNPSAGATNATELSNGWYYVDLSTTDSGTLGDLVVRGTAASCDDSERLFAVVKATNAGLTGIPDAVAGANAGLPVLSVSATTLGYTITTATNLTNLPAITTGWLNAAGIHADALLAIANKVEAEIIDETDSEKVLLAITNKIASVNPSLADLTLAAIGIQVRAELAVELARIDVAISTRTKPADTQAAVGSVTGDVEGKVIGNVEGHLLGNVIGNVNGTIGGLTAGAQNSVAVATTDALTSYQPILEAGVWASTARTLTAFGFTVNTNVTKVNNVTIGGTGTVLDPWGPA